MVQVGDRAPPTFYSDSTILSAQGAGCKTYDHAITQLPYAFMGAVGAAILFLIAGLLASELEKGAAPAVKGAACLISD